MMWSLTSFLLFTLCFDLTFASLGPRRVFLPRPAPLNEASVGRDLLSKCEVDYFNTYLDHFSMAEGPNGTVKFPLRYFVCDHAYRQAEDGSDGPIFFYLGNEADVLLYLNATGLMWENAERFGAMLIFAEHRYYGKSMPFGEDSIHHMSWLTSEQALADYARLIDHFQHENDLNAPVIGFGGSYGGMLAAWARLKYPHIWAGVIAASAPIWTFEGMHPDLDTAFFAKGVTYDASEEAGAAPGCKDAIRDSWDALLDLAAEDDGLEAVSNALRICPSVRLNSTANVTDVRDWLSNAFDYMAMGNYPYPSSYMLNGNGMLPAYPMRVACDAMMDTVESSISPAPLLGRKDIRRLDARAAARPTGGLLSRKVALLEGLAAAVGVWYNYTGSLQCYNPWQGVNEETQHDGNFWDWQYCAEQFMPMSKTGRDDMFWDAPFNDTEMKQHCYQSWNITPRLHWANTEWGGRRISSLTNVIFSNGLLDPWHGGGVMEDVSDTVQAVVIPEGAHHLDLMFSTEDDPDSVRDARELELDAIADWIEEFYVNTRREGRAT